MSVLLSIIIPNYNSLKFLNTCLTSVRDQISDECEVIVVDDGSSDASVEFIKCRFSEELKNGQFRLVCIDNSGPGSARNMGVSVARGEYIGFLDSDDFILPGYVERSIEAIANNSPDIIQFNILRVMEDAIADGKLIKCHSAPEGLYQLSDVRNDIFGVGKWFPVTRIFRRAIMSANAFPSERVFYEDLMTLPFIFFKEYSIYLIDKPLIVYRDNPNGITRNHKSEHARSLLGLFNDLISCPHSSARDLLLVQVARSIVYFKIELRLKWISLDHILCQLRSMENSRALIRYLGWADILFLCFPRSYIFAERIRRFYREQL